MAVKELCGSEQGRRRQEENAKECRDERGDQGAVGAEEHHGGHPGQRGAQGGQSRARVQWRTGPAGAVGRTMCADG